MQIKERGRKLALIRSEYVPSKKRTVGRFVASLSFVANDIPDDVRSKLTDDEIEEVRDYLCRRSNERNVRNAQIELSSLPSILDRVADLIEEGGEENEPPAEHVQDVYAGIDRLQKVLRKHGYKRQKMSKGQNGNQDVDSNQSDLL